MSRLCFLFVLSIPFYGASLGATGDPAPKAYRSPPPARAEAALGMKPVEVEECGGPLDNICPDGEYCRFPVGACDDPGIIGTCSSIPLGCPDNVDPVCGCDGVEYFNECEAQAVGVSLQHRGPCDATCGGIAGVLCAEGEFCNLGEGHCCCDYQGFCTARPESCIESYDPVCGCDGVTYSNECFADAACVSVDYLGTCEQPCGGPNQLECGTDEYCKLPIGVCDSQNALGICIPTPTGCTITLWDPVCGCDGVTYGLECLADLAGVPIAFRGECSNVCGGIAGVGCPTGEFCKLNQGECCCDFQGMCTVIPDACPDVWLPVCGCDGRTYANECEASAAGMSVDHSGRCDGECGDDSDQTCVTVIVDMDAQTPGIQSNINIPAGTTIVEGVAVYILDPSASHSIHGIGFIGGIDRGIGLGHMPDNANTVGRVVGFSPQLGTPVTTTGSGWIIEPPGMDRAFAGPELQYLEWSDQPGLIRAAPAGPVFTVDVALERTQAGDIFGFCLVDFVTIWSGGSSGAFSSTGLNSLDSGGDSVPDGTRTLYGVDLDVPIATPPAAFAVDYVDGDNAGGATITVVARTAAPAIPAASTWGLVALALLLLTTGSIFARQRTTGAQTLPQS